MHDGLVHQRMPFRIRVWHRYLRRLVEAHHLHHAVRSREDACRSGFLRAAAAGPARAAESGEGGGERACLAFWPGASGSTVVPGQAAVGIGLAVLIITAWTGLHVFGVFFYPWSWAGVVLSPLLVAVLCWLNVGLFIIAHDAMHGSLAPIQPRLNRAIGRLTLLPVVSRQRFFSVAPDRSHVIGTTMADLGELRGFGVGWC